MSTERPLFPLKRSDIEQAEQFRRQKKYAKALNTLSSAILYPVSEFSQLDEYNQKLYLESQRIIEKAQQGRAQRAWHADVSASRLRDARDTIVYKYRDEQVKLAAERYTTNTEHSNYDFDTEMGRDEVDYDLTLAALTGNTELLNSAIQKLDTLKNQTTEPTAKTLIEFSHARLVHQQAATPETFEQLKTAYEASTTASAAAQNWERSATVAARFAVDAVKEGKWGLAWNGAKTAVQAVTHDLSTLKILPNELWKEATTSMRNFFWRVTGKGKDYSNLELPPKEKNP